jgi:O-methyltransferase involved in polyketide biosynthesis
MSAFETISMTAKLTVFMRQASGIPFAREVAEAVQADKAVETLLQACDMRLEDILWYAPLFETRYKSVAALIRQTGHKQVLELASGLSLRGLAMTLADPELTYIETDLEALTDEKAHLIGRLQAHYPKLPPDNHRLAVANALNDIQLRQAAQLLHSNSPVTIVTEGLLQYLSLDELETVTRHVTALLAELGGVWITTDFSFKADSAQVSEQQKRFRSAVMGETGHPMYEDAFDNAQHLQTFFERQGFAVETLSQAELIPQVVSTAILDEATLARWKTLQPHLKIWRLTPFTTTER